MIKHMAWIAEMVWQMLPTQVKEKYYCDTGTIGFIEKIADLCYQDLTDDQYEELHNETFGGDEE